jgi:glycosyltransferase involved in cell wall biosynthesis
MLVSVIIPSYNHERFLRAAINSVLEQTHSELELIIIDDGSTDNSLEVARSVKDQRVRVYSQENLGAHAALNRGLELARGEVITILNSDDEFHPRRIETLLARMKSISRVGLICSYIEVIDQDGNFLAVKEGFRNLDPRPVARPELTFKPTKQKGLNLLASNYIATTSNMLFSASTVKAIGGFRPYRFTHDWDFALRAAACGGIELIEEPLVRYRVHSSNTIREDRARMILEICVTLAANMVRVIQGSGELSVSELVLRLYHSLDVYGCDSLFAALLAVFAAGLDEEGLIREAVDPTSEFGAELLSIVRELADADRSDEVTDRGRAESWLKKLHSVFSSSR